MMLHKAGKSQRPKTDEGRNFDNTVVWLPPQYCHGQDSQIIVKFSGKITYFSVNF